MKTQSRTKSLARYLLVSLLSLFLISTNSPSSPSPATFVGASPCDQVFRPFVAIPANHNCELIKWKLTLIRNPEDESRSRFALEYTYGMSKPGTQGFVNDGTSATLRGVWTTQKKMGELPGKSIIRLQPENGKAIQLVKLNHNLLHFLDADQKLMIGNAGWSYTLNGLNNTQE